MKESIINWIERLSNSFNEKIDPIYKEGAAKYMRNQFEFLGLRAPIRKEVSKPYLKESKSWPLNDVTLVVRELWRRPEREFQHFAMELLAWHKKKWNAEVIELIEHCIITKSWWDTVDFLSSNCAGPYFQMFPKSINKVILNSWSESDNMWLNRTAILFQLKYKDQIDLEVLESCILKHAESKEFFHRKAIGWALRQHSRIDPDWVREFVNRHELSGLSKREALRNILP